MRLFTIIAAALVLSVGASAWAFSQMIDDAKAQCIVGEQADGYLGVVVGADADEAVRREVRRVNQERRAVYARLAEDNGVTISVAAALTAEKLIGRAPSGHCVRDSNNQWIRKN